jgi:hypothetical protein
MARWRISGYTAFISSQEKCMRRFVLVALSFVPATVGLGCAQRLSADDVRSLLDEPKGTVSSAVMPSVTRDLFLAARATSWESFATQLRVESSAGEGEGGGDEGVGGAVGDTVCVGGLLSSAANFADCADGDTCKAEMTLDSCLLRVGDPGVDEAAQGKIVFKLDQSVDDDLTTTALRMEFQGWESSEDDETLNAIDGLIALETEIDDNRDRAEVVFVADIDARLRRKVRGLFDDGSVEQAHLQAGLRFTGESTDTSARGSLEILALVDEDGGRDESVVIRLTGEGHVVDAQSATSGAALDVVGDNGTFRCTWSKTSQDGGRDGLSVASTGECIDEDGEVFSFEGAAATRD